MGDAPAAVKDDKRTMGVRQGVSWSDDDGGRGLSNPDDLPRNQLGSLGGLEQGNAALEQHLEQRLEWGPTLHKINTIHCLQLWNR